MRKRIAILLACILLISLCGCGKGKKNEAASSVTTTASATVTHTTDATADATAVTTPSITVTSPSQQPDTQENVVNIALFGIDHESGSAGRSDAVIILSVDYKNSHIKLTSIARDTLVPIAGHREEKLCHAWAYGGVDLALDTLNNAFGTHITYYSYVNFADFATIIDQMGGVEIEVNEVELKAINYTANEAEKLPGVGVHRLNGAQALRYVRCRTDSDTNRTARQRNLIHAMLEEAQSLPIYKLPGFLASVQSILHTNLPNREINRLVTLVTLQTPVWDEMSLPNSRLNAWSGIVDATRGWVYIYDLKYAAALLHDFIYNEDTASTLPKPTKPQPN